MYRRATCLGLLLVGCTATTQPPAAPPPAAMPGPVVPVRLVSQGDSWHLERGGAPYVVRGAGYHAQLDALVAAGGNAIRTWGIGPDTRALLDEAWAKGVTVTLGIWLGHVEHGFDYGDADAVAEQLAQARRDVERFKDHPALLMWGVGNEVELEAGGDPRVWAAIEAVAKMIQQVDPHHPTMAVTAELGAAHDQRLKTLCPSIDLWGINSYGGAPSLPARLTGRGWTGPYALTEFGGFGDWERPKLAWGATREQTSTEKAATYRTSFEAVAADPRAVGTFAFLWGPAEKPADTWYALFGPDGARFEPTDVLAELWGKAPPDRAPTVQAGLTDLDGAVLEPGATITATLAAVDPEGAALSYDWVLHKDALRGSGAGPTVRCARGARRTFTGRAPTAPGPYRLLGIARDPKGGAAFASARFHVGPPKSTALALPLWVDGPFNPSGWMGDASKGGLKMSSCAPPAGVCSGTCRRFEVRRGAEGWSAVAWHHPDGNWKGDQRGVDLPAGARHVEFVAWGDEGGEVITVTAGNKEVDGFEVSRKIELTRTPTTYRLPVVGFRYTDVVYGFVWAASAPPEGEVLGFSIADITWTDAP